MVTSSALAGLTPELINKIRPVTLASERLMDVPEPLRPLFPWGGLARGTSLGVDGAGAWSLVMALLGTSLGPEGWVSVVGAPSFSLAAAAGFGVRLDRVLFVQDPGPSSWARVISSLIEASDIVVVAPSRKVGRRDASRLKARIRDHESVLIHLDGGRSWPSGLDTVLSVDPVSWDGLGWGHGYLRSRTVEVSSTGRRVGGGVRSVTVWLPGDDGRLVGVETRSEFRPKLVASVG